MDPQNPQIKHPKKCQEDAAGNKQISDFVNGNVRLSIYFLFNFISVDFLNIL